MSIVGRFAGMTVNERLFGANLLTAFDAARSSWDKQTFRSIFYKIGLPDYDLNQLRNVD